MFAFFNKLRINFRKGFNLITMIAAMGFIATVGASMTTLIAVQSKSITSNYERMQATTVMWNEWQRLSVQPYSSFAVGETTKTVGNYDIKTTVGAEQTTVEGTTTITYKPMTLTAYNKGTSRVVGTLDLEKMLMPGSGTTAVPSGKQVWTTPGTYTWTVPAGVSKVTLSLVAGGGGGTGGMTGVGESSIDYGGASGGYGEFRDSEIVNVTPGATMTAIVGAGGSSAKIGQTAGNGGNSSFGSVIARGGTGGRMVGYTESYPGTSYGLANLNYGKSGLGTFTTYGTAGGSGMVTIVW